MELNRNLGFEVFRYEPSALFIFEAANKSYNQKINSDVSYIQYLLEDVYQLQNIRSLSMKECKESLRFHLQQNILVHFFPGSHKIRFYNFSTQKNTTYPLFNLKSDPKAKCQTDGNSTIEYKQHCWVLLSSTQIFFTSAWERHATTKNFKFNVSKLALEKQPDFKIARLQHLMMLFDNKIWAFFGLVPAAPKTSPQRAEYLDRAKSEWDLSSNSPKNFKQPCGTTFGRKLYLWDQQHNTPPSLIEFDPYTQVFQFCNFHQRLQYDRVDLILATEHRLHAMHRHGIFILSKQGDVELLERYKHFDIRKWVRKSPSEFVGIDSHAQFRTLDLSTFKLSNFHSFRGKDCFN